YLSYPDQWDLMTDGTAAVGYIPADGGTPFGGGAYVGALTDDEAAALHRVGIDSGHTFQAAATGAALLTAGGHPTLNPYAAAVTAPTAFRDGTGASSGVAVFIIDATSNLGAIPREFQTILARDNTARFVVFGVGQRCTMVGRVIQNAPTSVPQNKEFTPSTLYSRTGVVFQVAGVGISGTTERARFIGAVALEDDEIESTEKDLVGYYDVAASGE
ncbi:MAG: hypothetical protein AB7K24_07565, partial [Gemmataceae bacterium]